MTNFQPEIHDDHNDASCISLILLAVKGQVQAVLHTKEGVVGGWVGGSRGVFTRRKPKVLESQKPPSYRRR